MLESLLPEWVIGEEAFDDPPDASLFPEEEAFVARARGKRRVEFTTVRHCARRALARLDLPAAPILPGERGAPGWPPGAVGSMTHCAGYRAAALSRDALAVGIDAEPHGPLRPGVLGVIASPAEAEALARLGPGVHGDRLLFTAKETFYKAWFPLTGEPLGFKDVEIDFAPEGTFSVRFTGSVRPGRGAVLTRFAGRWLVADGLVISALAIPRRRSMETG